MKIEIQASGENHSAISAVLDELSNEIFFNRKIVQWSVVNDEAQASAVVVQEEKEGE